MFLSNYHSHCTFCDGRSSMEEFVQFAIAKGLKKYGFSSHAPLPFRTFWNMNLEDFPEYREEFLRLKKKYAHQIDLFIGLEVDYIQDFIEIRNELYDVAYMDYLIGSVHYMDPLPNGGFWCIDGNFEDFHAGLQVLFDGDIRQATERFFEMSAAMIRKGGFDMVGHFDKIAMNGSKCEGFSISHSWYQNLVGDTLQLVKEQGMILEINTKSLVERGITFPDVQFYPLINELQIPIVVNSDCHYPTNITTGFDQTHKALKKAGFRSHHQLVAEGKWEAVELF